MAITGEVTEFSAYRDRATGANIDFRPTEEILAELDGIEARLKKEGGTADGNGNI